MADPRDPHRAEREAEKLRLYNEAMAELDTHNATHLTNEAITECTRCDDQGYRNNRVCDHIDRTHTATTGIAKVRDALAKARQNR